MLTILTKTWTCNKWDTVEGFTLHPWSCFCWGNSGFLRYPALSPPWLSSTYDLSIVILLPISIPWNLLIKSRTLTSWRLSPGKLSMTLKCSLSSSFQDIPGLKRWCVIIMMLKVLIFVILKIMNMTLMTMITCAMSVSFQWFGTSLWWTLVVYPGRFGNTRLVNCWTIIFAWGAFQWWWWRW